MKDLLSRARAPSGGGSQQLGVAAFDAWYSHVFRYKQHLGENDEVVDIVEVKKTNWEAQVFGSGKSEDSVNEVKHALCRAIAKKYDLDEVEASVLK